jgi:hypothetical protein
MNKKIVILILLILSIVTVSNTVVFASDAYVYNAYNEIVPIVSPFSIEQVIEKEDLINLDNGTKPLRFEVIEDVFVGREYVYVVDSGDGGVFGQIIVLDKEYNYITSISNIYDQTGEQVIVASESETGEISNIPLTLSSGNPTGVFETDNNKLYIALQSGERVVVLDTSELIINKFGELTFNYVDSFTRPENLIGATGFKPYKIAVDNADRMYIVVESGREGIIELNADGSFSRYYGTNPPKINMLDYFWRNFMSDIQLEQIDRIYAPPFSSIAIDTDGFKYVSTNTDDSEQMIYRFNSSGTDVLREMGHLPPIGDVAFFTEEGVQRSSFVSITVNEFGTYAVLDQTEGRIFVYNFDGELLFVFGSLGEEKGQFLQPSGITWDGDKLIVTDSEYNTVTVFKPTEFGGKVLEATESYYKGEFEKAGDIWEEVAQLNSNYEAAYVGIGKKHLIQQEYKLAMYYFELGHSKIYYSKAYEGYRNQQFEEHFLLFSTPLILLMGYVVYTEIKYTRKGSE